MRKSAERTADGSISERAQSGTTLGRIADNGAASALFLICLCLLMFLPGQAGLPVTDRDEARFVQATRQMQELGNYVDIRLGEETRYAKPVGIYWLQTLTTAPVGGAEAPLWAFRLPSFLAVIASVFAVWMMGRTLFDRRAGLLAALLFAPIVIVAVEARLAKTDAVLLACIVLSQVALASAWRLETSTAPTEGSSAKRLSLPRAMMFWAGLGAGILVKGPVAPMIVGLTGAALSVRIRSLRGLLALRPVAGVLLLAAIVLPWGVAIAFVSHGEFLRHFVGVDVVGRATNGLEGHGAPPGLHLALIPIVGWPLAAFFLLAIPAIVRRWREPAVFFCLAWLVPAWLVFEAVATKLPHYTLPLYPALALLTAAIVAKEELSQSRVLRAIAAVLLLALPLGASVGIFVVPPLLGDAVPRVAAVVIIGSALAAAIAAGALFCRRTENAVLVAALSAALLYGGAIGQALPRMQSLWLSPRLVALTHSSAGCGDPELAVSGYDEPSLMVAGGTSIQHPSPEEAAGWLAEPGCRVAAVADKLVEALRAAAQARNLPLREVATLSGFNYAGGRFLTLHLFMAATAE